MALPKYLSETITIGRRTYLIEVKRHSGGQKYLIITQTSLHEDEQRPVIIFDNQIPRFMRIMDRAEKAALTTVAPAEDVATRKRKREQKKRVKANPPEFGNSGKRWTLDDDKLLAEQWQAGTSMETLMQLFKRRSGAIEVRMYKLGLLPPPSSQD